MRQRASHHAHHARGDGAPPARRGTPAAVGDRQAVNDHRIGQHEDAPPTSDAGCCAQCAPGQALKEPVRRAGRGPGGRCRRGSAGRARLRPAGSSRPSRGSAFRGRPGRRRRSPRDHHVGRCTASSVQRLGKLLGQVQTELGLAATRRGDRVGGREPAERTVTRPPAAVCPAARRPSASGRRCGRTTNALHLSDTGSPEVAADTGWQRSGRPTGRRRPGDQHGNLDQRADHAPRRPLGRQRSRWLRRWQLEVVAGGVNANVVVRSYDKPTARRGRTSRSTMIAK